MKATQMILLAMATYTPMMAEAKMVRHEEGMNGTKNGIKSNFKRNKRIQSKHGFKARGKQ